MSDYNYKKKENIKNEDKYHLTWVNVFYFGIKLNNEHQKD